MAMTMMFGTVVASRPVLADELPPAVAQAGNAEVPKKPERSPDLTYRANREVPTLAGPLALTLCGVVAMGVGAVYMGIGGQLLVPRPGASRSDAGPAPAAANLFLGIGAAISGTVMLGVGGSRLARYQSYQKEHQLSVAPMLSRNLYGVGVTGRF